MSDKEIFDTYLDDVMNMRMSVHAFGLVARNVFEKMENRIEELELNAAEHKRLEAELNAILHPNGSAPENPSFCDLVSYVRQDLVTKRMSDGIRF